MTAPLFGTSPLGELERKRTSLEWELIRKEADLNDLNRKVADVEGTLDMINFELDQIDIQIDTLTATEPSGAEPPYGATLVPQDGGWWASVVTEVAA